MSSGSKPRLVYFIILFIILIGFLSTQNIKLSVLQIINLIVLNILILLLFILFILKISYSKDNIGKWGCIYNNAPKKKVIGNRPRLVLSSLKHGLERCLHAFIINISFSSPTRCRISQSTLGRGFYAPYKEIFRSPLQPMCDLTIHPLLGSNVLADTQPSV